MFDSHLCPMPLNKPVYKQLLTFFGIGPTKAKFICETLGVSLSTNHLNPSQKDALNHIITTLKQNQPGIDAELRLFNKNNIQRLININAYRWNTTLCKFADTGSTYQKQRTNQQKNKTNLKHGIIFGKNKDLQNL